MSRLKLASFALVLCLFAGSYAVAEEAAPVDPQATPEARALLKYLYSISGKYILSGQHNFPTVGNRNSQFAARYTGRMPVVYGTDWGFAVPEGLDSYLARPKIVATAIRQHQRGALVTICWHAVPPTADEPVDFSPQPNSDPGKLTSVQGRLLDEQFHDVLTPGTKLHEHWAAQVDEIAKYLRQLQDAKVPVLWRPYHEMNADWFWWGGRVGQDSTSDLYRQLYDRLVNHDGIHNLVWVWNVDRVHSPAMEHAKYYPGSDYVDVLSLDVYGSDFAQSYYDSLVALSDGKPLVLGEVGHPPSLEVLDKQPRWAYYLTWAGMVRNTSPAEYRELMQDGRVLGLDDEAYAKSAASYWQACGVDPGAAAAPPADFSGFWVLDEDRSKLAGRGQGFLATRLEVRHSDDKFTVLQSRDTEWGDWHTTELTYTLDGKEHATRPFRAPRVSSATRSGDGATLQLKSTTTRDEDKVQSQESWHLEDDGQTLVIDQSIDSSRGHRQNKLVYRRWR